MTYRLLIAAVTAQGLSGVVGGLGMVMDPSGRAMGLPLALLDRAPFADYLLPGLILLTVLGIAPLVVARALWTGRSWAWPAALLVGAALAIWIVVQILMIGYQSSPPLQASYGLLAVLIIVLALTRTVRDRFR